MLTPHSEVPGDQPGRKRQSGLIRWAIASGLAFLVVVVWMLDHPPEPDERDDLFSNVDNLVPDGRVLFIASCQDLAEQLLVMRHDGASRAALETMYDAECWMHTSTLSLDPPYVPEPSRNVAP